jgi:hypothetical protein
MSLVLPHRGWLITCTEDCTFEDHPLGDAFEQLNLGLFEEDFPEVAMSADYDPAVLRGHPRVVSVQEMWYFTNYDIELSDDLSGRWICSCMGNAVVHSNRETALEDLARVHEPVRLLRGLCQTGARQVRLLARAALDGDTSAVAILADALEEAGDPQAEAARRLAEELAPKKGKGRRRARKAAPAAKARPRSLPPSSSAATSGSTAI